MSSLTCGDDVRSASVDATYEDIKLNRSRRPYLGLEVFGHSDFRHELLPVVRLLLVMIEQRDLLEDERADGAEADRLELELFALDLDQADMSATKRSVSLKALVDESGKRSAKTTCLDEND